MSNAVNYERDLYAWAMEQAALLRSGRLAEADVANIAEEIESLGRSEKRELVNRLAVLLLRLLKWTHQSSYRSNSWRLTIIEQRTLLAAHLGDNPSLRARLSTLIPRAYRLGLLGAQRETGLGAEAFPESCPWTPEQVLDEAFLPE